jgi:methionine-R-sulfoxide reductase
MAAFAAAERTRDRERGGKVFRKKGTRTESIGETDARKEELKEELTPLQYAVACEGGTEPAFHNEYWDNHEPGIFVDIVSGKPLFSSTEKFDSGTGWPSFFDPMTSDAVATKVDSAHGMVRTEAVCATCGAHLGHVFDDGPTPTGLRYCMNSASLNLERTPET